MSDKPTHLLYIAEVDDDLRVQWASVCPWEPDDPRRDCLYGEEPSGPCLWDEWDKGFHHPLCADEELCIGVQELDGEEVQECWDTAPGECDGFTSTDGDHLHPTDGCGLYEAIGWGGFGDNIFLNKIVTHPQVPMHVLIDWEPEGGCRLTVVDRQDKE